MSKAKAEQFASKLAKLAKSVRASEAEAQHKGHTLRIQHEPRLVAVMCPLTDKRGDPCGETFPLAKRGDRSTYNFAKWDKHLHQDHGLRMPTPVDVMGW